MYIIYVVVAAALSVLTAFAYVKCIQHFTTPTKIVPRYSDSMTCKA